MNLANSLYFQERFAEAEQEYARAVEELRAAASPDRSSRALGQALVLHAQALERLGRRRAALACLAEGEGHYPADDRHTWSVQGESDRIQFHAQAADLYGRTGRNREALDHADRALGLLQRVVRRQDAEAHWETLLGHWQRLPGRKIRNELAARRRGFARRALVTAETAKGRLLYWTLAQGEEAARERALDPARQARAVDRVAAWCAGSGRWRGAVSLYADLDGLALFTLDRAGRLRATWEAGFAYRDWLKYRMDPWDGALAGYQPAPFAAIFEGVMGELGSALWRNCPSLANGGRELLLIPHKALRNLPLQHAVLPGGARLSELFERVYVYPTLWDFAERLQRPGAAAAPGVVAGCVDPDGTLPFARLEGGLCCDPGHLASGGQVTAAGIEARGAGAAALLLSCHGTFNPTDPWRSTLHLADGPVHCIDMARREGLPPLVVLGACESGMSRRSASDEPVGFSAVLLRRRVEAVLAPLWPVDDCASALFLSAFFEGWRERGDAALAVAAAARTVERMTASQARERLAGFRAQVPQAISDPADAARIEQELGAVLDWLQALPRDTRPWSVLDWAAFQLMGGYRAAAEESSNSPG